MIEQYTKEGQNLISSEALEGLHDRIKKRDTEPELNRKKKQVGRCSGYVNLKMIEVLY